MKKSYFLRDYLSFMFFCFLTNLYANPIYISKPKTNVQIDTLTYRQLVNIKNKDLAKMLGIKLKLKHRVFLDFTKHRLKKSLKNQPSLAHKKVTRTDLLQKMKTAKLAEPDWAIITGISSAIFSLLTAFAPALFVGAFLLFIVTLFLYVLGLLKGSNIGCLGLIIGAGFLILGLRFFLLGALSP